MNSLFFHEYVAAAAAANFWYCSSRCWCYSWIVLLQWAWHGDAAGDRKHNWDGWVRWERYVLQFPPQSDSFVTASVVWSPAARCNESTGSCAQQMLDVAVRWSLHYCRRFAAATAVVTRMLQPTSELPQCLLMSLMIYWLLITLLTARCRLLLMPLHLFFFFLLLLFLAKLLTVQRCLRLLLQLLLLQLQKMEAACCGDEVAAVVVSDAGGCSDVAAFGFNHSYPQSPWWRCLPFTNQPDLTHPSKVSY